MCQMTWSRTKSNRCLTELPRSHRKLILQLENGTTITFIKAPMAGNTTIDHMFSLGKLPSPAKTILLNYNADVLSDN